MILQIHLWTGATPEEVKKLKELVKKKWVKAEKKL
jgi:hypothetical protein